MVLLVSVPYTLEKVLVVNTDSFDAGDLLVHISYFQSVRLDVEGVFRSYNLLEGKQRERMIHESSLLRLQGSMFPQGHGGRAGCISRTLNQGPKPYYLLVDTNNSIQSCSCLE